MGQPVVHFALQRIAADGRVPADQVDALARTVLASVNEAALLIARSDDSDAAFAAGQGALDAFLDRLAGEGT